MINSASHETIMHRFFEFNAQEINEELQQTHQKLTQCFASSENLNQSVAELKKYYSISIDKIKLEQIKPLLESYKAWVNKMALLNEKTIAYARAQAEPHDFTELKALYQEAIELRVDILKMSTKNKNDNNIKRFFHNVSTAAQLLFWGAGVFALFYFAFIAIPLLITQPFWAITCAIVLAGLVFQSFTKIVNCFSAFESFLPEAQKYEHEKNLLNFFKIPKPSEPPAESEELALTSTSSS